MLRQLGNSLRRQSQPTWLIPVEVLDKVLEVSDRVRLGLLCHIRQQLQIRIVNPELGQQASHITLLKLQLRLAVGQGKDPQLARAPVSPRADDVRQEQGQASVVVQPVHVDDAGLLFARKLRQLVEDVLGQFGTTRTTVQQGRIVVAALE